MKKILLFITIILGLSSVPLLAQGPNMNRYITLTVQSGKNIRLNFKAAQANTPVRIVSGTNTQDITVGTAWYVDDSWDNANYKATSNGTTMTIYGDITGLNCSYNKENLTALEISKNTQLTKLYCYYNQLTALDLSKNTQLDYINFWGNPFNTEAVNELYCSLTNRNEVENGVCIPLWDTDNQNHNTIVAATSDIARGKNWQVKYVKSDKIVPSNGDYDCPNSKIITLAVAPGKEIKIDLKASKPNSTIRITSGNTVNKIIVGTSWYNGSNSKDFTVLSEGNTIEIQGAVSELKCSDNEENLKGISTMYNSALTGLYCGNNFIKNIDLSKNEKLTSLDCGNNFLSELNVSNNTQLTNLSCNNNQITELDLTNNTLLAHLNTNDNLLSTLNISKNIQLEELHCSGNQLTEIDLTKNTKLKELSVSRNKLATLNLYDNRNLIYLNCEDNQLNNLDLSANIMLKRLYCYDNLFSTEEVNKVYCSLPAKDNNSKATIYPLNLVGDSNGKDVAKATSDIARQKNWEVRYAGAVDINVPSKGKYICEKQPNMKRYITINVAKDKDIYLNFAADADNTPIRIVSGKNTQNVTVGTIWYDMNVTNLFFATAGDSTMTVYGNISKFNCANNKENLSAIKLNNNKELTYLDISNNVISTVNLANTPELTDLYCGQNKLKALNVKGNEKLKKLSCFSNQLTAIDLSTNKEIKKVYCYDNPLNTQAVNNLYCSLPYTKDTEGMCYALNTSEDTHHEAVVAATSNNARRRNWAVKYFNNDLSLQKDIPSNGTHHCSGDLPEPNMGKFIILTVTKGKEIQISMRAEADSTTVRVINGTSEEDISISKDMIFPPENPDYTYKAEGTTLTFYGDINRFKCTGNEDAITGIDVSNNTSLVVLFCENTKIETIDITKNTELVQFGCSNAILKDIDVRKNTQLKHLNCLDNKLSSLDVSNNTELTDLFCSNNKIKSIDISKNTVLSMLQCSNNNLSSLDLSKNPEIVTILCCNNKLTSLDLSANTKLVAVQCYDNPFTTGAMNKIYCSLPEVNEEALMFPLNNEQDIHHAAIVAATSDNARNKKWKIAYFSDSKKDVPSNGNYNCNSSVDESQISGISVYPNPAYGKVQVQLSEDVNETLILVDLTGRAVLTADMVAGKANIDVSNLTTGTYFIKVGNRVQKLTVK